MVTKTAAAGGALMILLFVVSGGAFVSLGTLLPEGPARAVVIVITGFGFAAAYVSLLVSRIRRVFDDSDRFWREIILALATVGLLLVAFAAIYQSVGVQDASSFGPVEVTYDFWQCLYYSVITFTTVGYGDFQPAGVGKVMAALQGFVGYLVLGILASSSAQLIQNSVKKE